MSKEFWYRYEEITYAGGFDEFGDPIPGDLGPMEIRLLSIPVVRHTPKGVWLEYGRHRNQEAAFFLKDARRKFACPTKEEAKSSFIARKKRQSFIYRARASDAEDAISLGNQIDPSSDSLETVVVMSGWQRRRGFR